MSRPFRGKIFVFDDEEMNYIICNLILMRPHFDAIDVDLREGFSATGFQIQE